MIGGLSMPASMFSGQASMFSMQVKQGLQAICALYSCCIEQTCLHPFHISHGLVHRTNQSWSTEVVFCTGGNILLFLTTGWAHRTCICSTQKCVMTLWHYYNMQLHIYMLYDTQLPCRAMPDTSYSVGQLQWHRTSTIDFTIHTV